jgi:O-methyltransferase
MPIEGSAMLKIAKKAINSVIGIFGFKLIRRIPGIDAPLSLWESDQHFNEIYSAISTRTIVDKTRCYMIYQCAQHALSINGNVAEVGVYKGGTTKLLSNVFKETDKKIYAFDTFAGMPQSDPSKDTYKEGDFGDTSLENVTAFLSDCKNVSIYKGIFPISPNPAESDTFCLAHIDVDIYKSVLDCCAFFYPRMSKSGIIIFDDYGFTLCPGALKAVDEFFSDKPERSVYLTTGQCIVVKI